MNGDGTATAEARVEVEILEDITGDLRDDNDLDEIDTIGGLVIALAGRVPGRGEIIRHENGIEFEVLDGNPRQVNLIRIHGLDETAKRAVLTSMMMTKALTEALMQHLVAIISQPLSKQGLLAAMLSGLLASLALPPWHNHLNFGLEFTCDAIGFCGELAAGFHWMGHWYRLVSLFIILDQQCIGCLWRR